MSVDSSWLLKRHPFRWLTGWHYRLVGQRACMFMQRRSSTTSTIPSSPPRKWWQLHCISALESQFRKWESLEGDERSCMEVSRVKQRDQHASGIRSRSGTLWSELNRTGVKAVSIRFCGGQHLDHITAYSQDNQPVLELCRSDPRQVLVWTDANAN